MTRILIFALLGILNFGACDKEVNWATFPQIRSATARGSERAWLVTMNGDLIHTEDAGRTWHNTSAVAVGGFQSITMLDDQRGVAVNRRGKIFTTNDGGRNWQFKGELSAADWHFNETHQIQFMDDDHGWIVESLSVWATDDGGSSWRMAFSPLNVGGRGQPIRASFVGPNTIWVCGTDGEVYSTRDAGTTWRLQKLGGKDLDFSDIFFSNEKTGWLVGYVGGQSGTKMFRTDDGGSTWQLLPAPVSQGFLTSIYFSNDGHGWGCGNLRSHESAAEEGMLMQTSDGGQTWQTTLVKSEDPFFDRVLFSDTEHGWLLGQDNIYRTNDGGKSWQTVLRLPPIKHP